MTGSDEAIDSPVVEELTRAGAKIYDGHKTDQVPPDAELLVYSLAIPEDNPERRAAAARGLATLSYPEILGLISRDKYTIAVAGTHGKTTTTAMIAEVLLAAKFDPTVIVGSLLKNRRSNLIVGQSRYLVAEACEYRRSFLNLSPQILIITNVDNDHLDYYRDLADIQSAFAELATKLPAAGRLICQAKNSLLAPVIAKTNCLVIDYEDISTVGLQLLVWGRHNVSNAQAVPALGQVLDINIASARGALNNFGGTWRRLEALGRTAAGALIYDDYAHHPTEIKATLAAAREHFPQQRIIVAFQPHLYSRTKLLFNDLAASFGVADEVLLLPIYAAREPDDQAVTSQALAAAIAAKKPDAKYFSSFAATEKYLSHRLQRADVLITMGAGDVYKIAEHCAAGRFVDNS